MCLIRVRQDEEDEKVIATRVFQPTETTTVITPIPPAPAPPPPTTALTSTLVPTVAVYDASYEAAYRNSSKNYHNNSNSQQYSVSVVETHPKAIITHEGSERDTYRSNSRHRRHRHRHRSGSREREVTTYEFREGEYDTISVHSGQSRSRSIDYRPSSYYGQSPRSSYRYIDPRGSSQRAISGGIATVSTTTTKGHRRAISASETRGRERSREREMLTYGNPRLSTTSYRSYGGGGRRSRDRVIVVDDEHERIMY